MSADGRVRVLGHGVDAVHDHGGPPAHVGSAGFEIHNQRDTALSVAVLGIDWLVGSGCQAPSEVKAHPAFAELRLGNYDKEASKAAAVPPKGKLELEVGYAWQEAYMVHCDRFATRVHFDVAGERITATAEHRILRRAPREQP